MELTQQEVRELMDKSYANRLKVIDLAKRCGSLHVGGSLSAMEVMTVIYSKVLRHDPKNPKWEGRDYFFLSAGHKAAGYYVVLNSVGYFSDDDLYTYNSFLNKVPGHLDDKVTPGVEFPFGSLGHGLSVAGGFAIISKIKFPNRRIFVLMGDGEASAGSVWEAALSASKYKLDNLIAIIDANGVQSESTTEDILPTAPFENKYRDFGWSVRTIDGHDVQQIYKALSEAPYEVDKPTLIVANTIKGKGIDFAEGSAEYHYWAPTPADADRASECIKICYKKELEKIG